MTLAANDLVLVTGVAPGVGKTRVAACLMSCMRQLGRRVVGIKPIEVGVPRDEHHDLGAPDADLLAKASDIAMPPLVRAPYRFVAQAAPLEAAARTGIELSIDDLVCAVETAAEYGQLVVIDAIGAALTPIAIDGCSLDLAARLGARVVLVLPAAPGAERELGAVLEACRARGLALAGFVLSHRGAPELSEHEIGALCQRTSVRRLGMVDLEQDPITLDLAAVTASLASGSLPA